jgi:hypothetical protein
MKSSLITSEENGRATARGSDEVVLVASEVNLNLALRLRGKQNPFSQPISGRQKAMT